MNEKDLPGRREKLIRGILRYLIEHPDAKDTVEGIVKWWRPESKVEWEKQAVRDAVDALASKGWLTKREISREETVYGVNKLHIAEIKNFLRETGI